MGRLDGEVRRVEILPKGFGVFDQWQPLIEGFKEMLGYGKTFMRHTKGC